jgi:hypothetical protein
MNNEKNHFAEYIESQPPLTPEQYRLVKKAFHEGFNKAKGYEYFRSTERDTERGNRLTESEL